MSVPADPSPEEIGLIVPRLVLTAPRLILGVVIWPIRHGLRFAEANAIGNLTTGPGSDEEGSLAVLPFFAHQSHLGPTLGLQLRHDGIGRHGETASLDARFFGRYSQAYRVAFGGDRVLGSRLWLETQAAWQDEPSIVFAGIGDPAPAPPGVGLDPRSASVATRMRQTGMLTSVRSGYTIGGPGHLVKVGATATLEDRRIEGSEDGPSVESVYDVARLPGFDERVRTIEVDGNLVIDTRDAPGKTASGVYADLFGGGVPGTQYRYLHYGGEASLFVDLYHGDRVLLLRASHEAVMPRGRDGVPLPDLPSLGGPERLRGYELGRFRAEKTAAATVEYRYPIHEIVAGALFVDAGRAASTYRRLAQMDAWRVGAGAGLLVRDRKRVIATLSVAYGGSLDVYLTTDPVRVFSQRNPF